MTEHLFQAFDIIIDVQKKEEKVSLFKKLANAVFGKCQKKRPTTTAMENIQKMYKQLKAEETKFRGFRINNNSFEARLLDDVQVRESNLNKYLLMRDFSELVRILSGMIEEPVRRQPEYELEIVIEVPRPKKLKKVTTFEKITILERWVKIGYQMYRRHFDSYTGEEYIVVDGDVYLIKSDRYGREYLA